MEGLAPFLFFIALIIINVLAGSAKKKRQQQQQQLPPDMEEPTHREDIPIQIKMPQQTSEAPKRPLDYMMSKPQRKRQTPEPTQTISINTPTQYQEIPVDTQELSWQANDKYQAYLQRNKFKQEIKQDNPDVIRANEISDKQRKLAINIEKQQIMQAITYAQVLEQPKSLQYLKRFGIKRVMHKD